MIPNDPMTTARIVGDVRAKSGVRITSFEICFPRVILAEVNTHRLLSKSSASSRAIPVNKRLAAMDAGMIWKPDFTGAVANKPGMQSTEKIADDMVGPARMIWDNAAHEMMEHARQLHATGVHKQYVNRLLEPFMYQKTILTGTEWDNYFKLRAHKDAQPEFADLATKMRAAYETSNPLPPLVIDDHEVFLPYYDLITDGEILKIPAKTQDTLERAFLVSSARCARVSYNSFETGKRSTWEEDEKLANTLLSSFHMSPFDHPAIADEIVEKFSARMWAAPERHRQFFGWIPYRDVVETVLNMPGRRNSFKHIDKNDLY